ncbi:MAG: ATP-binding protein [Chitinophagales bacterium]
MQIIMQNLTNNAIKALKNTHNPTIVWKAYKKNDIVVLQITDNGPGLMKKLQLLLSETQIQSQKNGLGLQIINEMA